jgi:hypothetical protein
MTSSRRVRKAFITLVLLLAFIGVPLSPVVTNWLARGQSMQQLHQLTGRTKAWATVLSNPRPETNKILGSGLSNDTVFFQVNPASNGAAIDSSWVATYQNQGLLGDVLDGAMLLCLLLIALLRPSGPARALAVFLVVYCSIASFTESGLGGASPYLLDLTVAAALLAAPTASFSRREALVP